MTPFAYQYLDLDYDCLRANVVLPTVRAVYEETIKRGEAPSIDALYSDGSTKAIPTKWFKAGIKLDRKAIRAEVGASIVEETKWWEEYQSKIALRDPSAPKVMITGCCYEPGPPDTNVKKRVAQLVNERQWGWKTADQVDWAALEATLVK